MSILWGGGVGGQARKRSLPKAHSLQLTQPVGGRAETSRDWESDTDKAVRELTVGRPRQLGYDGSAEGKMGRKYHGVQENP